MMEVKFKDWTCHMAWRKYTNGRHALQLVDAVDGDPIATATVNLPHVPLPDGEVIIKSYNENTGMVEALVKAGVIDEPHRQITLSPWAIAHVAKLNVEPE